MRKGSIAALGLFLAALAAQAGSGASEAVRRPVLTHRVASGDVRAQTAIVWARASIPSTMRVQVATAPRIPRRARTRTARATAASDQAARVRLTGLRPNTRHYYRIWFTRKAGRRLLASRAQTGSFRTAPTPDQAESVRFVASGDLGGQDYCREVGRGYAILGRMASPLPDFFLALGDMIYADDECDPQRPVGARNVPGNFVSVGSALIDWQRSAQVRETYMRHWRYNRADVHSQRLLRSVPLYSMWDDHEVLNDFGGAWPAYIHDRSRPGYRTLVAQGRAAFLNYGVVEGARIYRSVRWGRDVEVFIVDCRSYRSENNLADTPENAKTMLGAGQLAWLKDGLTRSTATWKIVASDVPIAAPSGTDVARDGWANGHTSESPTYTGFEREMRDLLSHVDAQNVKNVVVVSGDVHQARNVRFEGDYNGDGDRLTFHELISGPLSAQRNGVGTLDRTFGPTQLYAEGRFFNYRLVEVRNGTLTTDVRGDDGVQRPGSALTLTPQ